MALTTLQPSSDKSVAVVGAGGNIGSHLVTHLARMTQISRITLIDKDDYEPSNLYAQDITPRDVGKPKAMVQAERLRRIKPSLRVEPIANAVERIPMGKLRSDAILSCLDSRIARQHINQFAWRLGIPLIDAGVDGAGLLARVNAYMPGPDAPCLECAWDDRDYEALEQTYPCLGQADVAATNAPSSLGALAASLQAIECLKLLMGQACQAAVSKQVLLDATHHKQYVTAFRRNPNCRFSGHEVWSIKTLDRSAKGVTLSEALGFVRAEGDSSSFLRVEGKAFATRLSCTGCGAARSLVRLECSLQKSQTTCGCGRRMVPRGFDTLEELSAKVVSKSVLNRSLHNLGLRAGEVFGVRAGDTELYFELP